MNKTKPRKISESLDVSELRWSSLNEVIEQLKAYQRDGWSSWDVSAYENYGDMSVRIELERSRLETEEEMEARLRKEDHWKEMRRKQYESLKKEFEGK